MVPASTDYGFLAKSSFTPLPFFSSSPVSHPLPLLQRLYYEWQLT